jgi:formylglycine-generating enzyme
LDTGWDKAWVKDLPLSRAGLIAAVKCGPAATWTDEPAVSDNRPMNCISWLEAQAFCIWDGGRLPTEAEWNFAAAGGALQKTYPWGEEVPGKNTNLAVYGCFFNSPFGACNGVFSIAPVGFITAGNAWWGHADMAGNLSEWVSDNWSSFYPEPCEDCAEYSGTGERVIRGGHFNGEVERLTTFLRASAVETDHLEIMGARCARNP